MHQTALLGVGLEDAQKLGWEFSNVKYNWGTMLDTVNKYVRSLNWNYRVDLKTKEVEYFNSLASFVDPHTIKFKDRKGEHEITGENIVIAVGGRPYIPDIPGKEYAITSDDIFWKEDAPGKTLVCWCIVHIFRNSWIFE
eukprot:UN27573